MKSPYFNLRPPYTLPSNIVYFHDWRYVNTGNYAWLGPKDEAVPMMDESPVPPMHYEYRDIPLGVHLEAEPARKSELILHPKQTGDMGIPGAGSLIKEDGVYRLWLETWPMKQFKAGQLGDANALRYLESDDGVLWRQPKVGPRRRDNIVFGGDLTPTGYHGGSVFRDPSAPSRERYKAFYMGHTPRKKWVMFGATSPDGLRWKVLPKPVLKMMSDTHNICEFDPVLKKYVAYMRTWFFRRRSIGRTMSDDFSRFPFPEDVFWPDATQAPHDTWYSNAKSVMPGAPDYHVMFPMRWHLPTDSFDFHLATSPDNIKWGMIPGGAVCKPGEPGTWDAGIVAPGLGLTEWGRDRTALLYGGAAVQHKYPRRPPFGGVAWAWWPKGRLVALRSPLEGSFLTWPLLFKGRTAHLNFRTKPTGYVQVAAYVNDQQIPGRMFTDCDPLTGDHLDRVVTWRGQSDLGHKDGEAVELRFRLRNADLFAIEFRR